MIDDLIKKGNLVKTTPDLQKAQKSLLLAQDKIEKAKQELDAEIFDSSLISSYTAMFHTARAFLFKDGYKERNHYSVYEYLREIYSGKIEQKYINELNILRTIRHKVIYGDENVEIREIQCEEAQMAIKMAEGFLKEAKKLV
ncbi:MAG: HEPN domain-containing protein [Candidatus Micrarchaeota archaeon]